MVANGGDVKPVKVKPQKPTTRLHKLLMRAHRILKKEYPEHDVVIQPMFLKGGDIRALCEGFGKSGRFAVCGEMGHDKYTVAFDVDLDQMPDDFVLFHFLHELIHAGFEETDEAKAISMTFGALKKLGINRGDFMRRYQHLLAKSSQ